MKNKLGYLGFLGFLAVLAFVTKNYSYLGFVGFLYFFRYFAVIPDELFKANVQRAATPAFFVGLSIYAVTVALTAFHISAVVFVLGLVAGFAVRFSSSRPSWSSVNCAKAGEGRPWR